MGFSEEELEFFKIAKGSKFVVECDWKDISQNVRNLAFSKKEDEFFEKKSWFFWNR